MGGEQVWGKREAAGVGGRHCLLAGSHYTLSNFGHLVLVIRVGTATYLKQPQPSPCVVHVC